DVLARHTVDDDIPAVLITGVILDDRPARGGDVDPLVLAANDAVVADKRAEGIALRWRADLVEDAGHIVGNEVIFDPDIAQVAVEPDAGAAVVRDVAAADDDAAARRDTFESARVPLVEEVAVVVSCYFEVFEHRAHRRPLGHPTEVMCGIRTVQVDAHS